MKKNAYVAILYLVIDFLFKNSMNLIKAIFPIIIFEKILALLR